MEPAATIIRALGGNKRVAEILGIKPERVAQWKQKRQHNGGGGRIPLKHTLTLLQYAAENGVPLGPEDFQPRHEAQ